MRGRSLIFIIKKVNLVQQNLEAVFLDFVPVAVAARLRLRPVALLAHVRVQALHALVAEAEDWKHLAHRTRRVVLGYVWIIKKKKKKKRERERERERERDRIMSD